MIPAVQSVCVWGPLISPLKNKSKDKEACSTSLCARVELLLARFLFGSMFQIRNRLVLILGLLHNHRQAYTLRHHLSLTYEANTAQQAPPGRGKCEEDGGGEEATSPGLTYRELKGRRPGIVLSRNISTELHQFLTRAGVPLHRSVVQRSCSQLQKVGGSKIVSTALYGRSKEEMTQIRRRRMERGDG